MLPLTSDAPTTAERIRSACARAGGALLAIENEARATSRSPRRYITCCTTDPSPWHFRPTATTAGRVDGSQALLELTDYAPLPLREPVRSLVWVRGRLQQVPPDAVPQMLDLIATEDPDPALLQVETPRSVPPSGPDEARYTLLRLEIASVVVTDATGAEPVSVADLLAARPDPFCEIESSLLWHLDHRP